MLIVGRWAVRFVRYRQAMSQHQVDPTQPCPLCGEAFGVEPLNVDHVFGEAFAGSAKVPTHQTCNNDLGRGAEGRLHRPNSILSLFKAINGLPTRPTRGTLPNGTEVDADLAGNSWALAKPSVSRGLNSDGKIELTARATEAQMRKILKDWAKKWPGRGVPTFDELTSLQKEQVSEQPDTVEVNLVVNLSDQMDRVKKVALGCGVLAFGSDFATSPLAGAIRAATLGNNGMALQAFADIWDLCSEPLLRLEAAGHEIAYAPNPLPAPKHQATFIPISHLHRTAIMVHILGYPLLGCGLIVEGDLPLGRFGVRTFPVMLREHVPPYNVYDLEEIVMDATMAASAVQLEAEDE